jgi:hypothetical protein
MIDVATVLSIMAGGAAAVIYVGFMVYFAAHLCGFDLASCIKDDSENINTGNNERYNERFFIDQSGFEQYRSDISTVETETQSTSNRLGG